MVVGVVADAVSGLNSELACAIALGGIDEALIS